jgi:hypothetical protein
LLYGSETLFLRLREEHRLRVFENRMLRRIFERNREEVTGVPNKMQNEEHVTRMGEIRNTYNVFGLKI